MDMSTTPEEEAPDLSLHTRITEAVVKLCCVSMLAHARSPEDHRVDMAILADMIAVELLLHVHPAGTTRERLEEACMIHDANVRTLIGVAQGREQ